MSLVVGTHHGAGMIGATAKAEQFQSRSGSDATKGSRKGFGLLGGGDDPIAHLSPEERRASLVAVWKRLQIQLSEAKARGDKLAVTDIGHQITECSLAIHAIRPKRKHSQTLANYFIEACKKSMTKPQYQALMAEARRLEAEAIANESAT
jgi:hypothetical protein